MVFRLRIGRQIIPTIFLRPTTNATVNAYFAHRTKTNHTGALLLGDTLLELEY